mgnify:CR=1 FL=1|tara:strand:+ start:1523 stop:1978 length:456 start_codon:yes stop_codon:yes gene_type:complete
MLVHDPFVLQGDDGFRCREGEVHDLEIAFQTKRRGVESKIIIGGQAFTPERPDQNLIQAMQRSAQWWRPLTEEPDWTVDDLAKDASMSPSNVTLFSPLAFLAPDIVEAITDGRQPVDLNLQRFKEIGPIPADWAAQRQILGFDSVSNSSPK